MSRDISPFGVRMPVDLKAKIDQAAKQNGRSLNAEIVDRLQRSFYEISAPGLTDEQLLKVRDEVIKALYTDFVLRKP